MDADGFRQIPGAVKNHAQRRPRPMATIQKKGEHLRQAITWISEQREDRPDEPINRLIDEASMRFNLTPKDEVYLESFYREASC
jgi:hypothetical protein